jgi:hypothetical protein
MNRSYIFMSCAVKFHSTLIFQYHGMNVFVDFLCLKSTQITSCCIFLLGEYSVSEFYMPTFRNIVSVPSSHMV